MPNAASLPREQMLARMYASDRSSDGCFLTGVLTTGIYCLPSCRARKPKSQNVRFFESLAEARAAGLRPCRRCRPDDFYAGYDADGDLAAGIAAAVRRDPGRVAGVDDLVHIAGVGATRLHTLFRQQFHMTPGAFLTRARVDAARQRLEEGEDINQAGFAVGFEAVSTWYDQFRRLTGLTPGEYRSLGTTPEFRLRLPTNYHPRYALRVLARQPANASEGVAGSSAFKVLRLPGGASTLRLEFAPGFVRCCLEARHRISPADARAAHGAVLRLLGLPADPAPFERRLLAGSDAGLVCSRRGLRVPLAADAWEGLVWAIIGQQINLPFACALRRDLIALCGDRAGPGLQAHPGPAAIAALDTGHLRALRFSRRKAEYLIELAQHIASGALSLEQLEQAAAPAAAARLIEIRGIGPWSVEYILMRGLGFADCAPAGDVALALALQRYFRLEHRPDPALTRALMGRFTPYRSLATFHLWQTLIPAESA